MELMTDEIRKPQPDASKISRWGKKLLAGATDLGVAVAAAGISKLMFGSP
jgi:hypothetical protein